MGGDPLVSDGLKRVFKRLDFCGYGAYSLYAMQNDKSLTVRECFEQNGIAWKW